MKRSRILIMILLFCSIMLVLYAFIQHVEANANKRESAKLQVELRDIEVETAEFRLHRDSLRKVLKNCCTDTLQNVSKK